MKKRLTKIICLIITCLLVVYVPFFAIKSAKNNEIYTEQNVQTKIYTIWHVETFEGGSAPRINYLKKVARKLEKQHAGTLFLIKQIEAENLSENLLEGVPDIISFGFGVGKVVLPHLTELNQTFGVRDNLVEASLFNNKIYALPYISSGYALITNGILTKNFHSGSTPYTNPEKAYSSLNLKASKTETQYEAYKSFVYDKDATLFGTARDVFRVENLNKVGRKNASITPNDEYTDLLQYVGVTKNDEIIMEFLTSLFDDDIQQSLTDFGLFGVKNTKIYTSGIYDTMENAIFKCKIAKVFDEQN